MTTARELARRGWSVAVLEAGRIGGGASGRNCGFVLPGFGETMPRIVERVGPQRAREMWDFADAGRAYVHDTIRDTNMPGVDPINGWLWVSKFATDWSLRAEVDDLRTQYDADVELWPTDRVRTALRSSLYFNAVHYRSAFHIHPLNYALGLAAAAEADGVRIFEETPALSLDAAGVRKRIATPSARVRAGQIVLAGNVTLGALMPRLAATLAPLTTFVAVTEPLGEGLNDAVRYAGAISDTNRGDNHYRIVGGDRLLWSGGMRMWSADPRRFGRRLAADIRRVYPQLGKISIAHVWAGTLGRTVHRMPQIGQLSSGLWVASGFGGHGLNTTAMAGMLIARAIAQGDASWRTFQPYELVWAGGLAGRALMQAGYAGVRLRDRAKFLVARARRAITPEPAPSPESATGGAMLDPAPTTATILQTPSGDDNAEPNRRRPTKAATAVFAQSAETSVPAVDETA